MGCQIARSFDSLAVGMRAMHTPRLKMAAVEGNESTLRAGPDRASHVFMTGRLRRGTLDVHDVKNEHSYSQHRGDPDEPRVRGFIHKNIL